VFGENKSMEMSGLCKGWQRIFLRMGKNHEGSEKHFRFQNGIALFEMDF